MEAPERNLALDLVRATEAAALASARWLGKGDKESGDRAAVEAMRISFKTLDMDATVIIGEGEKDKAPMLYNGERLGNGKGLKVDLAVDPVEGTNLLATGRPNAIAVVSAAPAGAMLDPGPSFYMRKLVVPTLARGVADLDAPVGKNLMKIARALDKDVTDLVVFVLDKPRHQKLIHEIRQAGASIQLHTDGDVAGALMAVNSDSGVDLMMGTGGTPEGVLAACAIKALGGEMLCQFDPQLEEEKRAVLDFGLDIKETLTADTLVKGNDVYFAATGISGGTFLPGVRYTGGGATTHSLGLRGKTGTVRFIESRHNWEKLMSFSSVKYDA
ncbi:MAG: class II fructose-bisphosphatase [Desulfobacterium sp.]|jgi:fructose-1,6-bisphosphatase II|nr:class II fructose-bisphosphatase [Desulfobacterium sp.]